MEDVTRLEVDWAALHETGDMHGAAPVVRVDGALHVVEPEPTASTTDGATPAVCARGNWAIRRWTTTDESGAEVEVAEYHALRRVS